MYPELESLWEKTFPQVTYPEPQKAIDELAAYGFETTDIDLLYRLLELADEEKTPQLSVERRMSIEDSIGSMSPGRVL